MSRLFISHASANNAAATALADWLTEQGFDDIFLDIDPNRGLAPGERWQNALKAAADRCEAVLFLVSPAWVASIWCQAEFLLAKTLHKRIFGLIVEPIALDLIPAAMRAEWQLCQLVGEDQFRTFDVPVGSGHESVAFREAGLDLLRRGLERAGLDAKTFRWPPPDEPKRPPYPGLRALEEKDAAVFFGRDAAIVRGIDRIRGLVEQGVDKLLIVLGASGSGKSSFLRAGLWPRLARDDVAFLPLPVIRPETAAISAKSGLAAALVVAFEKLHAPRTPGDIKEALAAGGDALGPLLDELADLAKRRLTQIDDTRADPAIVLSIDQAEELFNAEGASEAAAFLDLVAHVLARPEGKPARVVLIVTMRSDRYELLQAERRFDGVKRDLFDLSPIPTAEFKSVIEGPAHRVVAAGGRLAIDPALTEQLIADAQGADALPLLAFTLERLHGDYGASGKLGPAEYAKLGGVQGSLDAAVARALVEPGRAPAIPTDKAEQLALLRAAFIPWLARVEPKTGARMRRVARLDEMPQGARAMVERLVAARLLVADRRDGVDVIEVAHESLLRRWPALTAWLEADADDLKLVEGIEAAAGEWARNRRLDAWLDHRAERLVAAERIMARADFRQRVGEAGAAYVAACRAREEAERRQREEALALEKKRLEEIAAAQARTARIQRTARRGLRVMAVVVLGGLGWGGWLYWVNVTLRGSLDQSQVQIGNARINVMASLSAAERLRGSLDGALRFALHAVRLDRTLKHRATGSRADAELAASVSQSAWKLVLSGHPVEVRSAAFSPDGSRVVTAWSDKTAHILDAATGKEIADLRGHELPLASAAFAPDGSLIVTASVDWTARIWDAATATEVRVLRGHRGWVMSAAFSQDGARIVTASADQTARIWEVATGQTIVVLRGHRDIVRSAAFSPDGSRVVTASVDGTARVWDVVTGNEVAALRGHSSPVVSAAYSPDGTRIVTASTDGTARIWNAAATGQEPAVLLGHQYAVWSAAFSPDGSRVITASSDTTARVWDVATGKETAALRGHGNWVLSAAFSRDGSRIVTASTDGTARVWDTPAGHEIATFPGHEATVWSAAFNSRGTRVVTASADRTARVWDVAAKKEILVLRGHDKRLWSAAFSRDGSRIVTASEDGTARMWDAAQGREVLALRGHSDNVRFAAFDLDARRIVTASADRTARIWDAATGREVAVLRGHDGAVWSAMFSPDGSRVVTASEDMTARIWDIATGKDVGILRGHEGPVVSAQYSPDGTRIVTASWDRTVRVWDAATERETTVLLGHGDDVRAAVFSPDGSRIATASVDKTARIWDALTGNEIAGLRVHGKALTSVAFSPDGSRIVTASEDDTARISDVSSAMRSTDDMVVDVCTRRLAGLTKLTPYEKRISGYLDTAGDIDVCAE